MTFSGAWVTQYQVDPQVPLVQPIDSQHLTPDPDPGVVGGLRPSYVNTAPAPDLPEALWPFMPLPLETGDGPVSGINYNDTLAGVGTGHGLTTLDAQDIAGRANMSDDGSYAANRYIAAVQRDGTYHASNVPDVAVQQDSPDTTLLQRTGVGVPNDPFARSGHRLERWFNGAIDMHRYAVTFRPLRPRYARTPGVQNTPDASQNSIHTPSVMGYTPAPADRFVTPMTRRAPGDWQTPYATDGTAATIVSAPSSYSLGSWGL